MLSSIAKGGWDGAAVESSSAGCDNDKKSGKMLTILYNR